MEKRLYKLAKVSLVLVYLVIVAGALVRMTGSGMGCPDWPKCFGYYIPPTSEETLLWEAGREFEKGQVIIYQEGLLVATRDFKTDQLIDLTNWESYTKHDYAVFNPYHTWVEFLNRLVGAVAGLVTLILALFSIRFWKKNKWVPILAVAIVLGMGFQAWLGATVVYSVLAPVKITTHMLMALLIVAALIQLAHLLSTPSKNQKFNSSFHWSIGILVALTLIQTVFGTQVREYVDHQSEAALLKGDWLAAPTWIFYLHRSFSLIPLGLALYAFWINKKQQLGFKKINSVITLVTIAVLSGMAMYYIDFPWGSQPIHLVVASLLFGWLFYLLLESRFAKKNQQHGI